MYTEIKTFEDACKKLNISPEEIKIAYPDEIGKHANALVAHAKLVIIAEAINEGWVPDWNDWDQYKYYPWFKMGSPSGGGFSFLGYAYWYTHSTVGSRLCFETREKAKYVGKQFEDLYKSYFVIE